MATKSTSAFKIFYVRYIRFCSQDTCKENIFKSHIISVCGFCFVENGRGCWWRHSVTLTIAVWRWHMTIFPWLTPYEIFSSKRKSVQVNHSAFETSHCLMRCWKRVHHCCNIFQIQKCIVVCECCICILVSAMIIQELISKKSFCRKVFVSVLEVTNN